MTPAEHKATHLPQGDYEPAVRHGSLIFTAGMTPRRNGVLQYQGPVASDEAFGDFRDAVELACANALSAVRAQLGAGEEISRILNLTVYIAASPGFTAHSKLADFASNFLKAELGRNGIGARTAIGVTSLPGNAPIELQLIAAL